MWPAEGAEEYLDHAPCGHLAAAPEGTIVEVNQTFLDWTGYPREELVGQRRLDELFSIPCRIYYDTHYAPLLRMQGFVNEIAVDMVRTDGRTFPALLNSVEKRDSQGQVVLVRTAVFDFTDRRRYERELLLARRSSEQAAKAKADFLAMFAHEVRNPLGAISLQTQLLERKVDTPEHRIAIGRLRSSLDRVLLLLNNMLDISKIEAGKVSLDNTPFGLKDVIQTVVHTLAPGAEERKLPLLIELGPELPERVRGDPVKLQQALTNLVGNAIKFTEKGSVTIGAERVAARSAEFAKIRFWVRDTGIGIARERQAQIFDEYIQEDPSIARRFGGTGLGLTITRKLLEMQGAHVQLESEPGQGSTFSFELDFKIEDGRSE